MRTALLCFALLALSSTAFAQDNPDRWIPPNSNAIAVVKVADLFGSKLGQRRKWVDEYKDAYAAGLISAPPSVLEVIRATEYRPYGGSQPVFSIYATRVDVSMTDIARHEMTKAEKMGDAFIVRSQKGAYFTRLGNKLLGALQPADRQLLARWLRFGETSTKAQTSAYIQEALENEVKPQVVVIVDLTDMIDANYAGRWLAASPAVARLKPNLQKLTDDFASLRGFRLTITVTDDIVARLSLDFGRPVDTSAEVLKAIVLEWLDESGARVASLANADAKVTGNSFALSSLIEEQGLRRVLSLIQTPHPSEAVADPNNTTEVPAANAIASKRYYTAVVSLVKDLMSQNRKAADYTKTALWHEQYAVKIENLSTLGVDADLAAWGYDVAQRLRALASSLRGVPVQVDKLERSIRYDVKTYNQRMATTEYGAFFRPQWFTAESNLQDVRAAQQDAVIKDQEDREQIWNMMEEDRLKIVAKMKEKYKVDFEK